MDIIIGTLMVTSSLPTGIVPSFSCVACFLFSAAGPAISISPVRGSSCFSGLSALEIYNNSYHPVLEDFSAKKEPAMIGGLFFG
jgi:hypothetical protein